MKKLAILFAILLGITVAGGAQASTAAFDDLTPTIAYSGGGYYENGQNLSGSFVSGGATFTNNYNSSWGSWDGWAYSNTYDTTTAGYGNQYSAITGGAYSTDNYGVFFESWAGTTPTITFGGAVNLSSVWITNTTYAYKAVVEGDDGNDPPFVKGPFVEGDWFKLTIYGYDSGGSVSSSLDVYLADYTDENSENWYALNAWTEFDLSSLGTVYGLGFDLDSTDSGLYGMNTPAYFAMDSLGYNAVPLPGAVWLLGSGLIGLIGIRRRT